MKKKILLSIASLCLLTASIHSSFAMVVNRKNNPESKITSAESYRVHGSKKITLFGTGLGDTFGSIKHVLGRPTSVITPWDRWGNGTFEFEVHHK